MLYSEYKDWDIGQADYSALKGAVIESAGFDRDANFYDGVFEVKFEDGRILQVADIGRSCCESRYMVCDAELDKFVGARFVDLRVAGYIGTVDDWGVHEIQFLNIRTSKGVIDIATHNDHNGYYGGFFLIGRIIDDNAG